MSGPEAALTAQAVCDVADRALRREIDQLREELAEAKRKLQLGPLWVTAIMFGTVALLVAGHAYQNSFAAPQASVSPHRTVPVAMFDLQPGSVIRESDIGNSSVKKEELTRGTILNRDLLTGKLVKEFIRAGGPINASMLQREPEDVQEPQGYGLE